MPELIRAAFTTLAPFVSGAERSLQVTLRHLPAAGVEPLVIGPASAAIIPWCERNGIPFVPCPLALRDKWHPLRWWQSVRRLRAVLRSHRVDLVHANQMWCYPAVAAAAGDLGLPRICHLRDEADSATLRWCCAIRPEAVVCISRHVAAQAEAAWPDRSSRPLIETRINPVELPAVPTPADGAAARRHFGVPEGAVAFGFIGQLRNVKGLLELFEVLVALPAGRPWHLLVAGCDSTPGGHYERLCRERAARPDLADRVTFLGFLDDPAAFYRAIDLAVVPSRQEPLGRVPLEAAAFARPSIAFGVGGLPDTIRDGETGWLVPGGDWPAFAAGLGRFLDHHDTAFGVAARSRVEQVADPAAYAAYLSGLYRRLVAPTEGTNGPMADSTYACTVN